MLKTNTLPALAIISLLSTTASAQDFEKTMLFEPSARDLSPTELVAPATGSFSAQAARAPVSFSRPLGADEEIQLRAAAHETRSLELWREVSASELEKGIAIHVAAPGALVRINPVPGLEAASWGDRKALEPQRLVITGPQGRRHGEGQGMDLMVTDDQLQAAGSPFPEGTSAFRLKEELGAGTFEVRAEGLSQAGDGRYVLHVLDRQSDLELSLLTLRPAYLHAEVLKVNIALFRGQEQASLDIAELRAMVTAPSGRTYELPVRRLPNGLYRGRLALDAQGATGPGLWEVQASVKATVDGRMVERAARTAFAAALPSARLTGDVGIDRADRHASGLTARLEIETISSGRYEVRGLLYGTDVEGRLRPLGLAHAAMWLEPGTGQVDLVFGAPVFTASELAAPYEVRDLQLLDQGRMALLQRQAKAFRVFE